MKYIKKLEDIDNISNLKGWVNVKIDEQLFIRMNKYVEAIDVLLDDINDKYNLYKKIEIISNIDNYINKENVDIRTKLSIITILQYLNELKNNFNPSSSGFLLEGFLAGLIHGNIIRGYTHVDMISKSYKELEAPQFETTGQTNKKVKYQIKLYKKGGLIKLDLSPNKICDFYVICLKDIQDKIDVHILSYDQSIDANIDKYKVIHREKKDDNIITINTNKLYSIGNKYKIRLDVSQSKIEDSIYKCGENIKNSIEEIYYNLSELEYDIDSIITGFDKNSRKIDIDSAKENADKSVNNISKSINNINI